MKISGICLEIIYDIDGDLISLGLDNFEDACFKLSILDKEKVAATGETTITFNNVQELIDISKHFKKIWKKLNEQATISKVE